MNEIDKNIWNLIKKKEELSLIKLKDKLKDIDESKISQRLSEIINNLEILDKLKKLPLIKQRTLEWHELRKDKLTASNLDEALCNNNLTLIKKKAGLITDNINYNNIPALKWGTMYEAMASRCYSQLNDDIDIYEFGLIVDENLKNFAASTDGINSLGIMIEIKCPFSREIKDNYIPKKYIMQIQGQLKVCNLNECDYIECDFKEYPSEIDYLSENELDLKNHGIIAEYKLKTGEYYYLYSDIFLNKNDAINNIKEQVSKIDKTDMFFIKLTYWRLNFINIQKVNFDKNNWDTNIEPKINEFINKVNEYKKQPRKSLFIEEDD